MLRELDLRQVGKPHVACHILGSDTPDELQDGV